MKKILITLILVVFLVGGVVMCVNQQKKPDQQYLRLHIRANSNSESDQSVKYKVKAAVVEYLSPLVANTKDKQEVQCVIEKNLPQIEKVANNVLKENKKAYNSSAAINNEFFPTRTYENLVLEEGYYDALIIKLGSGTGDNWWCVVYPPLCFIGSNKNDSGELRYKSKIKEIIDKIK